MAECGSASTREICSRPVRAPWAMEMRRLAVPASLRSSAAAQRER
jgi:hypothetical protein